MVLFLLQMKLNFGLKSYLGSLSGMDIKRRPHKLIIKLLNNILQFHSKVIMN